MTVLPLRAASHGRALPREAATRLAFPLLVVGLLACVAGYSAVALVLVRAVLALAG